MNTQVIKTIDFKMEEITKQIWELQKFKDYFKKYLIEIDICYEDMPTCMFFLEKARDTMETITKIYSDIDDISEYLFDNTDSIDEGLYIENMNTIKKIRDKLKKDDDERHFKVNFMVTSHSANKAVKIINNIAKGDNEKITELADKTKVKFNKLKALIEMIQEGMPIMTLDDFYNEYVYYLSYAPIEFHYHKEHKTVGDLDYNDYINDVINEIFSDSDDE
jgi:hypothetical protein|tara:strand:+ start:256 stop:915 length:660 start_codon:yes stop_codon:yes gene_type:complete